MPRVIKCPGSKLIQAAYPRIGEDAGAEGTVAHGIAQNIMVQGDNPATYLGESINNIYVDQEMLYHIQTYTAQLDDDNFSIEQNMPPIEVDNHLLTGTPDYWAFVPEAGLLKIKDFKYGFGWVEVEDNWQLITYAYLVYEFLRNKMPNFEELCKTIELTVIQPRANHPDGPVRSWSFDATYMRNYGNQLRGAVRQAALAAPPIKTGTHCRYCTGLLRCHGAAAAAGVAYDYSMEAGHTEATEEQLAFEMELVDKATKMLEQRKTALTELILDRCKNGKIVPGWESSPVWGNIAWDVDPILIGDSMEVDLRQDIKPITPTQAIARKLITEEMVEGLASRKPGGMKLKRVNTARIKRILNNG